MRKPISKKLRFEVLKRDLFSCQYCNSKPPTVVLEIDHIVPVSKGGKNNIDNLITACFDCNRGKAANSLDVVPSALIDKSAKKREAVKQFKEYQDYLEQEKRLWDAQIDKVEASFTDIFKGYSFKEPLRLSVKKFIEKLDVFTVKDCMVIACGKKNSPEDTIKYFCGICWNKIRSNE